MIDPEFIRHYTELNNERDGGMVIWELCRMSWQVMEEGKYGQGAAQELAKAAGISVDTIEYRRAAWIGVANFRTVTDFADLETGEEITANHEALLHALGQRYTYFAIVGRLYARQKITANELVGWLFQAARHSWTVQELRGQLKTIHGPTTETPKLVDRLRTQAAEILSRTDELHALGMETVLVSARQLVNAQPEPIPDNPWKQDAQTLASYATHKEDCQSLHYLSGVCTCGLKAALEEHTRLMEAEEIQSDQVWLNDDIQISGGKIKIHVVLPEQTDQDAQSETHVEKMEWLPAEVK